ncbi:hypothetical protein KOI35_38960 [Actinoplanes bogorensis]|uniref:DUF1850 domain-containing protein n=1 Tax=Paractinoplanes bogorensis TaxID=1610840 RepID=A0ABS5Z1F2_9ACTN|nr:hypothetical protein [Actinoplanes bogorensis]
MPGSEVAVHDVLADEATGYARHEEVSYGGVERGRDVGLWFMSEGSTLKVDRLPGRAAYPADSGPARLFTLEPGEVGRYRANFRLRFAACCCDPSWYYETWSVHVSNGRVEADRFVRGEPDHDVDKRVHLYGGSIRSGGRIRRLG